MKTNNCSFRIQLKPICLGLLILMSCGIFAQASFNEALSLNSNAPQVDAKIYELNSKVYFLILVDSRKDDSFIVIERSIDGLNYEGIGMVKCLGNNARFKLAYSFIDENTLGVKSYYRLVSFDNYQNAYAGEVLPFSEKEEFFNMMKNNGAENKFPPGLLTVNQ